MTSHKKYSGALAGGRSEKVTERSFQEGAGKFGPGCTGCTSKVSTNVIGLISFDFAMLETAEDYCKYLPNINILFY